LTVNVLQKRFPAKPHSAPPRHRANGCFTG
jgi:hypothetical protein